MRMPFLVRSAVMLAAFAALAAARPAVAQSEQDPGAVRTITLEALGEVHSVRAFSEGRRTYLNLGDLADAVGGAWGRDPLSREPLFTLGENRVLFSSKDKRVAVNGRRRRLSAPVEFREGSIYVPQDFLEEVLERLLGERVVLRDIPPPPPPAAGTLERVEPPPEAAPAPEPAVPGDWILDRERAGREVRRIVIDPGHGGAEEGAAGPSGLLEKDLVLQIARRLQAELRRLGFEVSLTRDSDVDIPLDERTAIANNRRADLFLSLHANASPSPQARGAETYYLSLPRAAQEDAARLGGHETSSLMGGGRGDSRSGEDPLKLVLWDMAQSTWLAESQMVAELIQAGFNEALQIPDRGVKQAPFRVLVGATMPAVLVEIGFISNPEEEARLRDPAFVDLLVDALVRSVDMYRSRTARRASQLFGR